MLSYFRLKSLYVPENEIREVQTRGNKRKDREGQRGCLRGGYLRPTSEGLLETTWILGSVLHFYMGSQGAQTLGWSASAPVKIAGLLIELASKDCSLNELCNCEVQLHDWGREWNKGKMNANWGKYFVLCQVYKGSSCSWLHDLGSRVKEQWQPRQAFLLIQWHMTAPPSVKRTAGTPQRGPDSEGQPKDKVQLKASLAAN